MSNVIVLTVKKYIKKKNCKAIKKHTLLERSDTFSLIYFLWIFIDAWSERLQKAGAENPAYVQTAFTKQVNSNKTLFQLIK